MTQKKPPEEITITGYVTATDWDWNDVVTAVSIETYDGDYVVDLNRLGEELLDEVDNEVEVCGIITEDRYGTKKIIVTGFEVLSEADDEEDGSYGFDENGQEFESEQGEKPM